MASDPASFDRVLRDHGPALARLARSYEREPARSEELLQDISLALWQAWPTFRGECSERTFVYRIAHNRGLSHAWKRPPAAEPLDALPEAHEPVDPRPRPEEIAAGRQQRRHLQDAILGLPLGHRQTVLLMLEGLSQAEMAEVLGTTENNVAVRLTRARAALRDAMGAREQLGEDGSRT